MDDGIRNVEGAEARMLLAQFFGQVITPEMKTLRSYTVGDSRNLQGTVIDPEAVVRAIPIQPAPPQPVIPGTSIPVDAIPGTQYLNAPAAAPRLQLVAPTVTEIKQVYPEDNPQLAFNFTYDAAIDLIAKVELTNTKVDKLIGAIRQLQFSIDKLETPNKKKPGI